MTWECPDCKSENPGTKEECACGYAYYKIMGIRPGEPEELVRQTYKHLMSVWQESKFAHDPLALKNARERKTRITQAYEVFKKTLTPSAEVGKKETSRVKLAAVAAASILVIAGLIFYITASNKSAPVKQAVSQGEDATGHQPAVESPANSQANPSQGERPNQQAASSMQNSGLSDILPEDPEEKSIALVKKSHVLDKIMDVDRIMRKWADENSTKFQILGWKAKKMDEQFYLVAFTISDGIETKGFYFDVDPNAGAVRHLADHPELQKKYNIQYKH